LESVLDVCADDALPRHEVENALTELVDKSIVAFDATRYQMLVSIRAFGRETAARAGRGHGGAVRSPRPLRGNGR